MNEQSNIKIIECPRDAIQGWPYLIPTQKKIEYINLLLKVGFDTIDFGSFVSAKVIPQMADTVAVINGLKTDESKTKLLAVIANIRGAEEALIHEAITYLGFPFSISPTFQLRNTNSTVEESFKKIETIQNLCVKNKKELVVYLSMGFGNPYGDPYNIDILMNWASKVIELDITIISLSDTIGVATSEEINSALLHLIPNYPQVEFGVHLHSTAEHIRDKLIAASNAGCVRFDGALKGIGGCPMAQDDLVGNIPTELMWDFFEQEKLYTGLDKAALENCLLIADKLFVL